MCENMASAGWRRNALRLLVCLVSVAGCAFQASAARDVGDTKSLRSQAPVLDTGPRTKRAYATFVYGEAFLLGVRVLGQSIRESETDLDMVVVAAGKISDSALATLAQDGWRVKTTDIVYNPALGPQSTGFPPAFWGVYTKLSMFNLSEYESVLYLDADTIVVNNAEDAFACPGFCAALRHSERFNSGVMKINPSTALYEDMMRKIKELPSYTGGDQGFLNAYFDGFYNGLVFDPSKDYSDSNAKYMRLPTLYNADIGLYVSNSGRWHVDESQIRVVHYTLGPLKPWDWWTSWLVSEQKKWKQLRSRLPRDSRGRSKGRSLRQEQAEMWLPIIPPLVVLLLWMRGVYCVTVLCTRFRNRGSSQYSKVPDGGQLGALKEGMVAAQGDLGAREVGVQPALLPLASILTGFACLLLAALLTLQIIPHEVEPFWGWLLMYEWTVFLAALWYAGFLRFCFFWGFTGRFSSAFAYTLGPLCSSCVARPSRPSSPIVAAGKANTPSLGTARQQTCLFLLLGVLLLVMCPKLASLLHAPSLVTKVVLTGVGGIIASIYLTYAFVSVSQLWYHCGQGSVHASR